MAQGNNNHSLLSLKFIFLVPDPSGYDSYFVSIFMNTLGLLINDSENDRYSQPSLTKITVIQPLK